MASESERLALLRALDVLWLVERGEEPGRACRRCGTTLAAVEKQLRLAGRKADWARIQSHVPVRV